MPGDFCSKQFRVYSRNSRAVAAAESARLAPLSGAAFHSLFLDSCFPD